MEFTLLLRSFENILIPTHTQRVTTAINGVLINLIAFLDCDTIAQLD